MQNSLTEAELPEETSQSRRAVTCNAMRTVIQTILGFLLIISCNEKSEKNISIETSPILIKVSYYPTFHQPAEVILNLNEKYLAFYSPSAYNPPPPPKKDGTFSQEEYNEYLRDRPELVPFKVDLSDVEISNIRKFVNSLKKEDYDDKDLRPGVDGMFTNIVIVNSDDKIIQINPMNDPKPKQNELYSRILQLVVDKNTNKNDSIILQKIKKYH
ncbi:hypothetical protein PG623_10495 [Riemerella anatipestifer]|nr:hypothetical protein [Riemerella anatipestifer]MDY3521965.1 hypothetical protein [Riemerella anatipestifer]MDY3534215.1 hypothetical protein [Riemerella anatipestifer]MDY3536282.1 hypothetical protein [Riemerella anatipestifer]